MLARAGTRSLDGLRQAMYVDRMVISSAAGTGSLSFEYLTAEDGYKVTMESDGLLVAAATDLAWDRLHAYLDSLAKDWRGWYGVRELSALPPRVPYSQPALTIAASVKRYLHGCGTAGFGYPRTVVHRLAVSVRG